MFFSDFFLYIGQVFRHGYPRNGNINSRGMVFGFLKNNLLLQFIRTTMPFLVTKVIYEWVLG